MASSPLIIYYGLDSLHAYPATERAEGVFDSPARPQPPPAGGSFDWMLRR